MRRSAGMSIFLMVMGRGSGALLGICVVGVGQATSKIVPGTTLDFGRGAQARPHSTIVD